MTTASPVAVVTDSTAPWRRAEPVLWRRTLGGVVLLPVSGHPQAVEASGTFEPIALRGSAADIWELLAVPMTAPDLVAAIAHAWGADEAQVAADVGRALDSLFELGALSRC